MGEKHDEQEKQAILRSKKGNLKAYLNNGEQQSTLKPLADLFLETTVLFADISGESSAPPRVQHCCVVLLLLRQYANSHTLPTGFTAWSSVREPTQVFILLETLYQAFDAIAKRRHVFKGSVRPVGGGV